MSAETRGTEPRDPGAGPPGAATDAAAARRRRRYRADRGLRLCGLAAISTAIGLLGVLIATLVIGGAPALTQTKLRVAFPIGADRVDPADPGAGDYRGIVRDGVARLLPPEARDAETLREMQDKFGL